MGGVGVRWNLPGRIGLAAAAMAALSALAGCSSVPSMPSLSSLFGSNSAAADSNASAVYTPPPNFECPDVTVRQGASTLAVGTDANDPSPLTMRYQVGFGQLARECKLVGDTVTMKVGVQGRIVLGPAGGPGPIDVPLRFAVIREGAEPKTITTKFLRLSVAVPPGDGNVQFTHVEEDLSFPMPKGAEIDSYVVYVGFDPISAREMDRKKPPARPARQRRQG
jgi:hypothetical protein